MDDASWLALTVTLTVLGAVATWLAHRRRGVPAAMLGAGLTLLVPAAYLTDTLRMLTRVVDAVADWATGLVLSPAVWAGIVLAGLGVLLVGASRPLAARGLGARRGGTAVERGAGRREVGAADPASSAPAASGRKGRGAPGRQGRGAEDDIDDDLADVEAILRRRGIS